MPEAIQGVLQCNIPEGLNGRFSYDISIFTADHLRHAFVETLDPVLAVQYHDPFGHTGEGSAELPFFLIGHPDFFLKFSHHVVNILR